MIEINSEIETKDYWRFYLNQYFDFHNLLFGFLSYTIFGWALSFLFLRDKFDLPHIIDVMIAAVFFTFFTSFVWAYLSVGNAKKFGGQKIKYVFTDAKIEMSAESCNSSTDWKYFQRIKETGRYFILFVEDGRQLLLPKKSFQAEELIDFKDLIRRKFGNEAYLKKGNLGLK